MHTDPNYKFIEAWGIMASTWGVTRSESQVYALLLIQNEQMSAEAIMADLHMSMWKCQYYIAYPDGFSNWYLNPISKVNVRSISGRDQSMARHGKLVKYYKRRSLDKLVELGS
ncbi:MAG: hypothetical protein IPF93_13405 [Saprospiraceae bacterium]|nr:hypothetical protein [Saprospiraceae bacterium]